MNQKRGLIAAITVTLALGALNLFLYLGRRNSATISGNFLENLPKPFGLKISIVAFILQWLFLLAIIFATYMRFLKHKKIEEEKGTYFIDQRKKTRSETDLDILYSLLQEKKSLATGTIAKIFKITKEKALEWSKILEDHDLVTIDYPTFDDPEIKIYEKEDNEEDAEETGQTKKASPKDKKETTPIGKQTSISTKDKPVKQTDSDDKTNSKR